MQTYKIPAILTKQLAQKDARMQKNALRLWFFCKTTPDLQTSFYLDDHRKRLLGSFNSYKQLNIYLDYLIRNGWMGRDQHGKIYLRGRNHMFNVCGADSRMLAIAVSHEDTCTLKAWSAFLAAAQVCTVQRSMHKYSDKVSTSEASTPTSGENSRGHSCSHPISCANISQSLQVSTATASRLRQRGHRGGFIDNRWAFRSTPYRARTRPELLHLRSSLHQALPSYAEQRHNRLHTLSWPGPDEYGRRYVPDAINADALVMSVKRDGRVFEQRPNMVLNIGIIFCGLSKGKRTIN